MSERKQTVLVVASFTARPLEALLRASLDPSYEIAFPDYNQVHQFLLREGSPSSEAELEPAAVVIMVRLEDWVRSSPLLQGDGTNPSRVSSLLTDLSRDFVSALSAAVTRTSTPHVVLCCPSLGLASRRPDLRPQIDEIQKSLMFGVRSLKGVLLLDWDDFASHSQLQEVYEPGADRLGHIPFTPECFSELASYVAARLRPRLGAPKAARLAEATPQPDNRQDKRFASFLASLKVVVAVSSVSAEDAEPIARLTTAVTGFNCSNVRHPPEAIRSAIAERTPECLGIRAKDRFGDYGLCGFVMFTVESHTMNVESFLLSCPVLGKQVEHCVAVSLARLAQKRGCNSIAIRYRRAPKNSMALDFLGRISQESGWSGDHHVYVLPAASLESVVLAASPSPDAVLAAVAT